MGYGDVNRSGFKGLGCRRSKTMAWNYCGRVRCVENTGHKSTGSWTSVFLLMEQLF